MVRLIGLILFQSVLLVATQTFLKISVQLFGIFSWTTAYFKTVFTTWQFLVSGVCTLTSFLVWMYVLKHYEFSLSYPLLSISYIISVWFPQAYFYMKPFPQLTGLE